MNPGKEDVTGGGKIHYYTLQARVRHPNIPSQIGNALFASVSQGKQLPFKFKL